MLKTFNFNLISLIILLNLFLGRYFENILLFNLPINQIFLVYCIFFLKISYVIYELKNNFKLQIYFIFLIIGLLELLYSFALNGMWALRDGVYIINSLYFFVGYHYGKYYLNIEKFDFFFKILIIIATFYLSFKLLGLDKVSPSIRSIKGNELKLINFDGARIVWFWVFFITLINYNKNLLSILLGIFLLLSCLIFEQVRTLYLAFLLIIIYISKFNLYKNIYFFNLIYSFFIILIIYNLLDISVQGRVGEFSFNFLFKHLLSLFFFFDMGDNRLMSAQGTAEIRLTWWISIIKEIFNNNTYLFFGKGFGEPLITFLNRAGNVVREPHNMLITALGRQGLIGLLLFLYFKYKLIKIYLSNISNFDKKIYNYVNCIIIYLIIIFVFFLSDSILKYSYISVPYYIFWGVVISKINTKKINRL